MSSSTSKSTPVSAAVKADVAALVASLKLDKAQPVVINKQPQSTGAAKLRSAESYVAVMQRQSELGWQIAWVRPGYAMLKTGVKGQWVAVCTHGNVRKVDTGAAAEKAGRARSTWCADCKTAALSK